MHRLDAENTADFLRSTGRVPRDARVGVRELAGGVSNVVLLVEPEGDVPFVLKQSREQLRTAAPWFSRLDRIWRETDAMQVLLPVLPPGVVPRTLFEDRENYLFAMEAIDPRHVVWKTELLEGRFRLGVAAKLGGILADLHAGTRGGPWRNQFADREVFVQLRVDPFYRHVMSVHADLGPPLDELIDEMDRARLCLVHADFSPKNVLIVDDTSSGGPPRIALVDYETVHYGDPAFDLGFFLSHLMLKSIRAGEQASRLVELATEFTRAYRARLGQLDGSELLSPQIESRAVRHLAGCALARVDATSPVHYLPETPQRERVRTIARRLLLGDADTLSKAFNAFEFEPRGLTPGG